MTSYIVDASVVAEFIVGGTHTSNARALFLGALEGDQFTVPDLCLAECTNVIWKMVRFHGMPSDQAITALRDLRALPLKRAATRYVLNTALAIGLKYSLAIYDSLYIALSQRTGNILVTIDSKQEQAARAEGVNLKRISEFV
jgi:predicted nucleic acid-binding protein